MFPNGTSYDIWKSRWCHTCKNFHEWDGEGAYCKADDQLFEIMNGLREEPPEAFVKDGMSWICENKEDVIEKVEKIDVRSSVNSKLKGNQLEVSVDWAAYNDKVILGCLIAKTYNIDYERLKDYHLCKFKIDGYRLEYNFLEDKIEYVAVNKTNKIKIEDKYHEVDWEYLIPYLVELGFI